jgi:hypothetical protein
MARLLFLLFLGCRMRAGIRGVRGSSRGRNEFRLNLTKPDFVSRDGMQGDGEEVDEMR